MNQIFWGYDDTNKTFAPFPASPFLIVALGFFALAWVAVKIASLLNLEMGPKTVIHGVDTELIQQYAIRYRQLMHKKSIQGELDLQDRIELMRLKSPPWAQPGETWTY